MNATAARQLSFENSEFSVGLEKAYKYIRNSALGGWTKTEVKVRNTSASEIQEALGNDGYKVEADVLDHGIFCVLNISWGD
tara:strand:+ start:3710 stop:3952 length:243 start_codon:yes stop_codon:yes gene_type:complete